MLTYTIRGADELDAKLAAAPQNTEQAIDQAEAAAAPLLKGSIQRETPVRTGFLRSSEDVLVRTHTLEFQAAATYASFVANRNPYDARGVANAELEVVAVFEREADELVREFDQ